MAVLTTKAVITKVAATNKAVLLLRPTAARARLRLTMPALNSSSTPHKVNKATVSKHTASPSITSSLNNTVIAPTPATTTTATTTTTTTTTMAALGKMVPRVSVACWVP